MKILCWKCISFALTQDTVGVFWAFAVRTQGQARMRWFCGRLYIAEGFVMALLLLVVFPWAVRLLPSRAA